MAYGRQQPGLYSDRVYEEETEHMGGKVIKIEDEHNKWVEFEIYDKRLLTTMRRVVFMFQPAGAHDFSGIHMFENWKPFKVSINQEWYRDITQYTPNRYIVTQVTGDSPEHVLIHAWKLKPAWEPWRVSPVWIFAKQYTLVDTHTVIQGSQWQKRNRGEPSSLIEVPPVTVTNVTNGIVKYKIVNGWELPEHTFFTSFIYVSEGPRRRVRSPLMGLRPGVWAPNQGNHRPITKDDIYLNRRSLYDGENYGTYLDVKYLYKSILGRTLNDSFEYVGDGILCSKDELERQKNEDPDTFAKSTMVIVTIGYDPDEPPETISYETLKQFLTHWTGSLWHVPHPSTLPYGNTDDVMGFDDIFLSLEESVKTCREELLANNRLLLKQIRLTLHTEATRLTLAGETVLERLAVVDAVIGAFHAVFPVIRLDLEFIWKIKQDRFFNVFKIDEKYEKGQIRPDNYRASAMVTNYYIAKSNFTSRRQQDEDSEHWTPLPNGLDTQYILESPRLVDHTEMTYELSPFDPFNRTNRQHRIYVNIDELHDQFKVANARRDVLRLHTFWVARVENYSRVWEIVGLDDTNAVISRHGLVPYYDSVSTESLDIMRKKFVCLNEFIIPETEDIWLGTDGELRRVTQIEESGRRTSGEILAPSSMPTSVQQLYAEIREMGGVQAGWVNTATVEEAHKFYRLVWRVGRTSEEIENLYNCKTLRVDAAVDMDSRQRGDYGTSQGPSQRQRGLDPDSELASQLTIANIIQQDVDDMRSDEEAGGSFGYGGGTSDHDDEGLYVPDDGVPVEEPPDDDENTLIKNKREEGLKKLQNNIIDSIQAEIVKFGFKKPWSDLTEKQKAKAIAAAFQTAANSGKRRLLTGWKYVPEMDWSRHSHEKPIKGLQALKMEGAGVTLQVESAGAGGGASSSIGASSEPNTVIEIRQQEAAARLREQQDIQSANCYICQLELIKNHDVNRPGITANWETKFYKISGHIVHTWCLVQLIENENNPRETAVEENTRAWQRGDTISTATRLAVGGADQKITVYNIDNQLMTLWVLKQPDFVQSIAFSPDGSKMAAGGGKDKGVTCRQDVDDYDQITWAVTRTLPFPGMISSIAYAPNGKTLTVAGDKEFRVYDTNRLTDGYHHGKTLSCKSVAYSPDSLSLAVADIKGVRLFRLNDFSRVSEKLDMTGVNSVMFSPAGDSLAVFGWVPTTVVRINGGIFGATLHTFKDSQNANCVAYAPDGKTLAVPHFNREVNIYDLKDGKIQHTIDAGDVRDRKEVWDIAYSPNGKTLAVARGTKAIIYKVPGYAWHSEVIHEHNIYAIAYLPKFEAVHERIRYDAEKARISTQRVVSVETPLDKKEKPFWIFGQDELLPLLKRHPMYEVLKAFSERDLREYLFGVESNMTEQLHLYIVFCMNLTFQPADRFTDEYTKFNELWKTYGAVSTELAQRIFSNQSCPSFTPLHELYTYTDPWKRVTILNLGRLKRLSASRSTTRTPELKDDVKWLHNNDRLPRKVGRHLTTESAEEIREKQNEERKKRAANRRGGSEFVHLKLKF